MRSNNFIKDAKLGRLLLILVIPALLGSIISQVNFILDSFYLSRATYQSPDILIAALATSFPIALFFMAIGTMFAIGGSIYATKFLGEGNLKKASSVFSGTIISSLFINFVFLLIFLIFLKPILYILGATNPEVLDYAYQYSLILVFGSPTIILSLIFIMFGRADNLATRVLISLIVQTVVNIILNYLFIIPLELGTLGAGMATLIAQIVLTLIVGYPLIFKNTNFNFTMKFKQYFTKVDLKAIIHLGFPSTLGIILITFSSTLLQIFSANYQDIELVGAIGIIIKFVTIFIMVVQAAASGIQPVFSYAYGAQDFQRFNHISKGYLKVSSVIFFLIGLYLIFNNNIISGVLHLENQTQLYINFGTICLGIMLLGLNLSFLMQIVFQSLGEAGTAIMIVLIRQLFIFVISLPILTFLFSEKGIIMALPLSMFIGSIITVLIYTKKLKKNIKIKFNKEIYEKKI